MKNVSSQSNNSESEKFSVDTKVSIPQSPTDYQQENLLETFQENAAYTQTEIEKKIPNLLEECYQKLEEIGFEQDVHLAIEWVFDDDLFSLDVDCWKFKEDEYRLPSEAQWEYACRAMTEPLDLAKGESYPPFYFGETLTDKLANYNASRTYADEPKGESRNKTTPVGQFPPNAFRLYDLHGNVWEWCMDDWHDNYENAPSDGSAWLDNNQEENLDAENSLESTEKADSAGSLQDENNPYSVMRGGSWGLYPVICRSAFRNYVSLRRVLRISNNGFRVVCSQ
ncbi:formylglycine-generating enzyme family protein [Microcystis sp. BLCC-F210]|uniref:formylglycine-generating enzyme family protein n=1 Tax=Microcystis sp. BLCC-F210 TaxID=3342751 RepID=UPI0035C9424F